MERLNSENCNSSADWHSLLFLIKWYYIPLISSPCSLNHHPPTDNNYSCLLSPSLCTIPSTYTEDIVRSPQAMWYCLSCVIHCNTCVSLWGRSVCRDLGSNISCSSCQQLTTTHSQSGLGSVRWWCVPVSLIQCLTTAVSWKWLNNSVNLIIIIYSITRI